MEEVYWFLLMAMLTAAGWCVGQRCGQSSAAIARAGVLAGAALLIGLTYLTRHPSVAVHVLPVPLLARVEGVAAVPAFMVILGVAWARSDRLRQKAVVGWAMLLGAVYFVNGGAWMLQQTPTQVLGQTTGRGDVMQSQDYSCVPAASATALRRLGLPATEAEMAELTKTRPGRGSTTVRALDGLQRKLHGSRFGAALVEVEVDELEKIPTPALTPLQYEPTRRHMVTLLRASPKSVRLVDPVDGHMVMNWDTFAAYFTGQVIFFYEIDG